MYYYAVFDNDHKYVGFADCEADAIEMATYYGGHYELEYTPSDSIFG